MKRSGLANAREPPPCGGIQRATSAKGKRVVNIVTKMWTNTIRRELEA